MQGKFRRGDAVRWHASAFARPEDQCGWIVQGVLAIAGLPRYHIWNAVTGESCDAAERDLEGPISIGIAVRADEGQKP